MTLLGNRVTVPLPQSRGTNTKQCRLARGARGERTPCGKGKSSTLELPISSELSLQLELQFFNFVFDRVASVLISLF